MKQDYPAILNNFPFPAVVISSAPEAPVEHEIDSFFGMGCIPECPGKSLSEFLRIVLRDEPERKNILSDIQKAARSGSPFKSKIFCSSFFSESPDQEYWQVHLLPLENEISASQLVLFFYDKTSEVRAKEREEELRSELQVQKQKQEHFVRNNSDGLYSLDREGKFLDVNQGLVKLAELPEEELLQISFLPFCAPESRQQVLEHFGRSLQGEKQDFEAEFISAKGNKLVLHISIVPIKHGQEVSGVFGIAKNVTPLRKTEEELQRKENKFRALVQKGSELMVILNLDGTFKFLSDNVRNILENSPSYYLGKNAFDFIHPEDKDRVLQEFSALEEKKQIKVHAYRFRDASGKWRWLEATAVDLRDDPSVEGVVANSREVTEILEQNRQIDQLHQRFKLAAMATNDLVYDWDLQTDEVTRFCTPGGKHFGYNSGEIDSREFWVEKIHPEEIQDLRIYLHQSLQDPYQEQMKSRYRFRRKDGSYAEVIDRATIIRNENGKALRLIGATSDISDIVENQNALKMANTRFSFAVKATKEMIWDWDIEKGKVQRSESFRKIFGCSPDTVKGENVWFGKIHKEDRERVKRSLDEAVQDRDVKKWRQEYRMLKKDNSIGFVIDRGFILRNEKGVPVRMVGALLDVTESREMISEIKKQNEILKKVAWEQAHVVRQPLARLKGLVNILAVEEQEEWTREELLNLIIHSAEELDEVISKIIRKTEEVGKNVE